MPVAAHSTTELDDWLEEWEQVMTVDVSWPVIADWTDMATRHPRYFGRHIPHTHTQRITSPFRGGVEQWRSLVATYFRAGDVDRAMHIMACESGGNPNAKNPRSSASGLFQHLGKYWAARSAAAGWGGASIFDPTANVAVAAWLRDQPGGFGHWVCRG